MWRAASSRTRRPSHRGTKAPTLTPSLGDLSPRSCVTSSARVRVQACIATRDGVDGLPVRFEQIQPVSGDLVHMKRRGKTPVTLAKLPPENQVAR
jgi:hypothetical protein